MDKKSLRQLQLLLVVVGIIMIGMFVAYMRWWTRPFNLDRLFGPGFWAVAPLVMPILVILGCTAAFALIGNRVRYLKAVEGNETVARQIAFYKEYNPELAGVLERFTLSCAVQPLVSHVEPLRSEVKPLRTNPSPLHK
ncbi:hypothetical protein CMI47_19725 [Candidatus Pacearchaeota archaeon]|nr:hypothetical protein [Candidatus Pacearchaeota archaeon]